MKKTKILAIDMAKVNEVIKGLEKDNFEIVQFNHEVASNGHIYIFLMAHKEADKSIYEKMYLLEKYCTNYTYKHRCLCKGCRIENMCDKYEGGGIAHWDFEDVKKAYEVIRDGDR
ncbi:hypothetical protein [Peptacetobacter hiranonis]|uniref:hypothetical protein n=1 Tax=Peptacetobacter hiranonis TaxID=89152 RepID=UPI002E76646B|nr:hypothetical protein [Peptacetobacter hiranonis]MEE0247400.1 hypothetical protein [Peptacetobacter hiranonis]